MPVAFRNRHQLVLCWLIVLQAVVPGHRDLRCLSRYAPSFITEWRLRRLLKAGYWSVHVLLYWFAQQVIDSLPLPQDRVIYLITDGGHKEKRAMKSPAAQKGRTSEHSFWFFGIRFIVLMVSWDVYRIPVDFKIVLPKAHPNYRNENELFREMFANFTAPAWAMGVIVVADAAFSSRKNMQVIIERNDRNPERAWAFVFAIARSWKAEDGRSLGKIVKHINRKLFERTWIPALPAENGRKTFFVFGEKICLRHVGEVAIVLSKRGRNMGPKGTKIMVTNLSDLSPRQVISIYQRRWQVELFMKEIKTGVGLGEHQVAKDEDRVEKSFAIAILSYLFLLKVRSSDLVSGKSWSIFQLQNNLRLMLITNQVEHTCKLKMNRLAKAA